MNDLILRGAARAMFVQWYAYVVEVGEIEGDAAGPGEDWMDVAPETPASAIEEAGTMLRCVKGDNGAAWTKVLARPEVQADLDGFGHYLAMEALGHGVAWSDNHDDHGLKLPYIEYMGHYTAEAQG